MAEVKGPAREVMSPEELAAEYLGLGRTYTYQLLIALCGGFTNL